MHAQHQFEVLDTQLVEEGAILALRRDTVLMPGGNTATRDIVEHFGACAVVAHREGRIAMIRQYRHAVQQRMWELPAGLLDVPEESALACAQRELIEEAGLQAKRWSLLVDVLSSPGFCDEVARVFLADDVSEVPRPQAHDEEADLELRWVSIEEAKDMVLRGEVHNSIAIAGIMTAYQVLVCGAEPRGAATPFEMRPQALARRKDS